MWWLETVEAQIRKTKGAFVPRATVSWDSEAIIILYLLVLEAFRGVKPIKRPMTWRASLEYRKAHNLSTSQEAPQFLSTRSQF